MASPGGGRGSSNEDEARAALVHVAMHSAPEEREARDYALGTLQVMASGAKNKRIMWEDESGSRAALLAAASLEAVEDRQARRLGLGALWNLASEVSNRQSMWGDEEGLRRVVLQAAKCPEPEVRELALGVLWNLSPKSANAARMWQDEATRDALVQAAKATKPEDRQARSFALAALQNLAEEATNRANMWLDEYGAQVALVEAAKLTAEEDKELRGRAVGALMNLSVEPSNKELMWADESGARYALVEAARLRPGEDEKSWTCALTALWSLAVEPANREAMWADKDGVRAVILAAAQALMVPPSDPEYSSRSRARERALGTLQYLTTELKIKADMWKDLHTRHVLVGAAMLTDPSELKDRTYALGALWNLSSCEANKEDMWKDAHSAAAAAVVKAARQEDAETRERGLAVLWNLSTVNANKSKIWGDATGAREVLLAAAMRTDPMGRKGREYAFGALRHLADDPTNRSQMWNHPTVRKAITEAAGSWDDLDDSVVAKRALKTLCALAYDKECAASVWSSAGGILAQVSMRHLDNDTHLYVMRAFQALSMETANKEHMLADANLRKALAHAAQQHEPMEGKVRISALFTYKNLTTWAENVVPMWTHDEVRQVLIAAAAPPAKEGEGRARAVALGALRNMAGAESNKAPMWADVHLQSHVLDAATVPFPAGDQDAGEAREHAMAILRHFASVPVGGPLWHDNDRARAAVVETAKLTACGTADTKAREHALVALRYIVA